MNNKNIDYRQIAIEQEEYKKSEKASNLYWGLLLVLPFLTIGLNGIAAVLSIILFILSISFRIRKVLYFILTFLPFPYSFVLGGFFGLIGGLILAAIIAIACSANYQYVISKRELEDNKSS